MDVTVAWAIVAAGSRAKLAANTCEVGKRSDYKTAGTRVNRAKKEGLKQRDNSTQPCHPVVHLTPAA
jgi:hypothetical protein